MAMRIKLNLPPIEPKLRRMADGRVQIYDPLRNKFVALTPEEWVRQNFVRFLIDHRGYIPGLMANEVGLSQNGCRRRCDTVVYDRSASAAAIVEYKAPEVAITAHVFDQIVRYNMELGVRYLMVSNGLSHYCCKVTDIANLQPSYIFLKDIPAYESIL